MNNKINNFTNLNLPEEPFKVATLQQFYFKNVQSDNYANAKNYIQQYYFETACGMYHFYNALQKCFDCREKRDFSNEVLKKVASDRSIVKYFEMNSKIYNIISRLDRPLHFVENDSYYKNECRGLLHKKAPTTTTTVICN